MTRILPLLVLLFSPTLWSSTEFDLAYRFHTWIPLSDTIGSQNRVYRDHIEKTLVQWIKDNSQAEYSASGHALSKKIFAKTPLTLSEGSDAIPKAIREGLKQLSSAGVDAGILARNRVYEEKLWVQLELINFSTLERISQTQAEIEDPYQLDKITWAVQKAASDLLKAIPFDATIIQQDGYRVILDLGEPTIKTGMKLSAYTIEGKGLDSSLIETGTIEITQAEEALSFGKVWVDKKPLEVKKFNKIRLAESRTLASLETEPAQEGTNKMPFAYLTATGASEPRGQFGFVDVGLGLSFVSLNQSGLNGSGPGETNALFNEANLNAELWLTSVWFLDLGFAFGVPSRSALSQNANTQRLHAALGYRLPFKPDLLSPNAHLKIGLANRKLNVSPSQQANSYLSTGYSGILMGAGATLPFAREFGLGLDIDGLFFSSVSESPYESGKVTDSSAWSFTVRAYYKVQSQFDLEAKLRIENQQAEFDGTGNRPTSVVSSQDSRHTILLGMNYYF